jgi:hypothetical protein
MTTTVTTRAAGKLNPTRQQLDELDALLQRMLDLPVQPADKPEQAKSEEPAEEPPPPPRKVEEEKKKEEKEAPVPSYSTFRLPPDAVPSVSYMFVETASPRPLPPASGFEPRPPMLTPRLVPVTPPPETPASPPPVQEADEGEQWVPLRSTWQPSAQTWPPLAESWHQANNGAPPVVAPGPIADSRPTPMPPVSREPEISVEPPANEMVLGTPEPELETPDEPQLSLSVEDASSAVAWPLVPLVWFNQGFDTCLAPFGAPGRWLCERGRIVFGFLGLACLAAAAAIAVGAGMGWSW